MLGIWKTGRAPLAMTLHFALRVSNKDILSAPRHLKTIGIQPLDFHGRPSSEPSVIGWMPAASVYFKDPDGHSLEYIAILEGKAAPDFGVQNYSQWLADQT